MAVARNEVVPLEEVVERFGFWLTLIRQAQVLHDRLGDAGDQIDKAASFKADATRMTGLLATLSTPVLARIEQTYESALLHLAQSADEPGWLQDIAAMQDAIRDLPEQQSSRN